MVVILSWGLTSRGPFKSSHETVTISTTENHKSSCEKRKIEQDPCTDALLLGKSGGVAVRD